MTQPRFRKGENVRKRATNDCGQVEADPELDAGEYWYRVRINSTRIENIVEEGLDALGSNDDSITKLSQSGKWGDLRAVRCALGVERIRYTNRSTLYAFQSQRILFQPYQYKPLLKILDSLDRRLLVADEVGLGKTIEAGLIMTELEARKQLDKVLIVCPSRLREKWRNELNRKFDGDFEIFDKATFLQAARLAQEKPGRTRFRGIISMQSLRTDEAREALINELASVDLVIVDEAHHARNRDTSTSGLLRDLCEVGESVVLLTATPVQLKNEDLFTLLNALRPTEFREAYTFDRLLHSHAPIHKASALARQQKPALLPEIAQLLTQVFVQGRASANQDPKALQVLDDISNHPPGDRSQWIELERQIQEIHPLATIVTRTKKRDVLVDAPRRNAETVLCDWTPAEWDAYQRLIIPSGSRGWPNSQMSFGQIQRARQAASCIPATYESHLHGKADDDSNELSDIQPSELRDMGLTAGQATPQVRETWTGKDSKFEKLLEILRKIWKTDDQAKVLVFTYFKGTARYLARQIATHGAKVLQIDGDVKSEPRHPEKDERGKRLEQFERDPDIKVLISTEVGSEGLDFQFCYHLVNYDLPWNPMVVEQRIGRIDRFGQTKADVYIHNLVVEGTVEERILKRLYERIGIFEQSIGALEAILGDNIRTLQRDYFSGKLSAEEAERRSDLAANVILGRKRELELLDQKASELFGHEEFIREEMNRVSNLGRYVSEESIVAILDTFLSSYHPKLKLKRETDGVIGLRITDDLRRDIYDATRGGVSWIDRSQDGILRFTTSGEVAFRRKELDLVNASHPLLKAAVGKLLRQLESPYARLGAAVLEVDDCAEWDFHPGLHFLVLFAQDITSIRSRRVIETIAWNDTQSSLLSPESSERLLYLMIDKGQNWFGEEAPPAMGDKIWQTVWTEARARNRQLREAESRENRALYVRRRNARTAEHEHDLAVKERRLQTAERKGSKKILPAFKRQIEKAKAEYRMRLEELDSLQSVSAPLSDPIAACIVRVVSKDTK